MRGRSDREPKRRPAERQTGGRRYARIAARTALRLGDAGRDEAIEEFAPAVDLDLEVAGAPAGASASSGVTPQPKCSKASVSGSQVARTAGPRRWRWPWTSRASGRT